MDDSRYYRHSGKFSPGGIVGALGLGLPVAVLMAFLYAYAIVYIPIIGMVSFILTAGFAAVVGAVTGTMLHKGRVRNTAVAYLAALPVAFTALWAAWVAWIYALAHRGEGGNIRLVDLVLNPEGLWDLILMVNSTGAWSFKGATPTGGLLWALWGVEALIIVGLVSAVAEGMVADPFCEDCERWCEEQKAFATLGAANKEELVSRLELSDFSVLKTLPGALPSASTRFDLHQCPQCRATITLCGKAVTTTTKGNKTETDEKDLFRHLKLTTSQLASLQAVLGQRAEAERQAAAKDEAVADAAGGGASGA